MTDGKPREPLWAASLADQPVPELDVLRPDAAEDEEALPRPEVHQPSRRRLIGLFVAAAVVAGGALALTLAEDGPFTVQTVPSRWGEVPMTCETTWLEDEGRTIEWFTCRAVGGGELPPGLYQSPDARWISDISRREALVNQIEISPGGELNGWAVYP